jgi:hypothetical protein
VVGVDIGLPHKAIERLRNGEAQADIARTYGVDGTTIGRLDCAAAYRGSLPLTVRKP